VLCRSCFQKVQPIPAGGPPPVGPVAG
jgi:hypothetical protein